MNTPTFPKEDRGTLAFGWKTLEWDLPGGVVGLATTDMSSGLTHYALVQSAESLPVTADVLALVLKITKEPSPNHWLSRCEDCGSIERLNVRGGKAFCQNCLDISDDVSYG